MKRSFSAALVLAILIGTLIGIGGYTFIYAKGYSYLSNNPEACTNCHVMRTQYDGWIKGSHKNVATCNDCHTPSNIVGKYAVKANNGFWHSFYFTTGAFPEPIQIGARDRQIAENACHRCHDDIVQAMGTPTHAGRSDISCIRCHDAVGHQELAAVSNPPR